MTCEAARRLLFHSFPPFPPFPPSFLENGCSALAPQHTQTAPGRNRPVLAWAPKSVGEKAKLIKMSEARQQLGFRSCFLFKNEEKANTTFVEVDFAFSSSVGFASFGQLLVKHSLLVTLLDAQDRLQEMFHNLGLPRRLHQHVGMGGNLPSWATKLMAANKKQKQTEVIEIDSSEEDSEDGDSSNDSSDEDSSDELHKVYSWHTHSRCSRPLHSDKL